MIPAWLSRWRAPPSLGRCSAQPPAGGRSGPQAGKVCGDAGRDAEDRRAFRAAGRLRGQRHRHYGSMRCATRTARPTATVARRWWRPASTHIVVDREFLPGRAALMVPPDAGRPGALRRAVAGARSWAPPTRRAGPRRQARPFHDDVEFILRRGRTLPRPNRPNGATSVRSGSACAPGAGRRRGGQATPRRCLASMWCAWGTPAW